MHMQLPHNRQRTLIEAREFNDADAGRAVVLHEHRGAQGKGSDCNGCAAPTVKRMQRSQHITEPPAAHHTDSQWASSP